ncbi:MAG: hypothetical protein ABIK83_00620 [Candidatus Zixiibacteriota bacterium]
MFLRKSMLIASVVAVVVMHFLACESVPYQECIAEPDARHDVSVTSEVSRSRFESADFKARIVSVLAADANEMNSVADWVAGVEADTGVLTFEHSYSFDESVNFVLLEYTFLWRREVGLETFPENIYRPIFFGYVPSTGNIYCMDSEIRVPLLERFNTVMRENEGTLDMPVECKAALLVRLVYQHGCVIVINEPDDYYYWVACKFEVLMSQKTKSMPIYRLPLFVMSPMDYVKRVLGKEDCQHLEEFRKDSVFERHHVPLLPLAVRQSDDSTSVELTTCTHLGPYAEEFAVWKVVFNAKSEVVSCWYEGRPLWLPTEDRSSPVFHREELGL